MPVYERDIDIYDGISFSHLQEIQHPEAPTLSETWGAAWDMTATQGAWDWATEEEFEDDPEFMARKWEKLPEEHSHLYSALSQAGSQAEYNDILARDKKNQENYAMIANSGVTGILSSLSTGILDPILLPLWFVPFAGQGFRAANVAGRIGRISAYAGADMAAREAIMHHAEPDRTANETYKNLLIAASVSAGLGVMSMKTMQRVPKLDKNKLVDELERRAGNVADMEVAGGSVGAMKVGDAKPSLKMEAPVKGAKWWKELMIKTPVLRAAFSTDEGLAAPAKRISELVYTGQIKQKHLLGIADDYQIPVDVLAKTISKMNRANNVAEIASIKSALKAKGVKVVRGELENYVEKLIVTKGKFGLPDHLEPYRELLMKMAKRVDKGRSARFARLKDQNMTNAEEVALYNEAYGPRIFSKKKMRDETAFWVKSVIKGYIAAGSTRTYEELEKRAIQAYRNATSTAKHLDASLSGIKHIPHSKHRVKPITLQIHDDFIEDWLVRDVIKAEEYLDRLEGELLLRERYGTKNVELGDHGVTVKTISKEYEDEFIEAHRKLIKVGKVNEADRLTRKYETYKKDLQHVLNKVVGVGDHDGVITGGLATFLNEIRAWTAGAWNGNSVIASVQEPMKVAIHHGFGPALKVMRPLQFQGKKTAQQIQQLKSYGIGMEMQSHHTAALARAEVDDDMFAEGFRTLGSRVVAPALYKWNGQNLFNDIGKVGAATVHGDQVIRYALGKQATKVGSTEYKMTIAEFANLGIGKSQLNRIKAMAKKENGFTEIDGTYFPNLDEWADDHIADVLGNSMLLYGDSIILSGGTGTVPRILDNSLGAMVTQFKRILFNMQGQTMVPAAQRIAHGDMRAARGVSAMVGVAWLQYQFRLGMTVGFDQDEFEKRWNAMTIQEHIFHAYDRSGLGGLMFDFFAAGDNMLEGGISSSLGLDQGRRRFLQGKTAIGNIMPAFAWGERVVRAGVSPFTEDGMKQADAAALGMSLPLRNIFYYDFILDEIQQAAIQDLP
jgi:hypothetical protein